MKRPMALILFVALFYIFSTADAGDKTEQDVVKQLRIVNRNNRAELDALTSSIRQKISDVPTDIVRIWMTGDANMVWKCAYVLGRLGDSVIEPLLEAGAPADPLRQV